MASRKSEDPWFFDHISPELTLKEVGMLMGVSDHVVFLAERSAMRQLRQYFKENKIETSRDLLSKEFTKSSGLSQSFANDGYSSRHGWFVLDTVKSLNGGSESAIDTTITFGLLRLSVGLKFRPQLFFGSPQGSEYSQVGYVEGMVRFGSRCLVRCPELRAYLRKTKTKTVIITAVVESEFGTDADGEFELPVLQFVFASAANPDEH